MFYDITKKFLFSLPTEMSHEISLNAIAAAARVSVPIEKTVSNAKPVEVMGLTFKNVVGLGAGLDKNGDCIDGMANLGFGFVEVGTVTPRPQPGNPKPRLFRAVKDQALVNRMGFNNKGVDHLVQQVQKSRFVNQENGVLGINIGKNKDTPVEKAVEDYLICLRKVYSHASYVTVNISSPNTADLRSLQHGEALNDLLARLKEEQQILNEKYKKYVPLVVKIAPDLSDEEIGEIAESLLANEIEGLIATNTSSDKSSLSDTALAKEAGGLSGAPILDKATEVQSKFYEHLAGKISVIGLGGISKADDALGKLDKGADLVQIYTGFIYKGPSLIHDIVLTHRDYQKNA